MLSPQDLVTLLRRGVNVQIPVQKVDEEGNPVFDEKGEPVYDGTVTDPNYLTMTDDDLTLFIKLGVTRFLPDVQDLNDLPDGSEYAVVLLAKIELYLKLAVARAEKVDMGVDNNTYLKQSQKFEHYMKLVDEANGRYKDWLANEGAELSGIGIVNTYNVLLSNRHYSNRNCELQPAPKVKVKVNRVDLDSVEFSWGVSNFSHFGRFKVYFSRETIIDPFADGSTYDSLISPDAQCVVSTTDIRKVAHRVMGLTPDTDYHIAVVEIERNRVFGYSEVLFTTLKELEEEPDIDEGEFKDPDEPTPPPDPDTEEGGELDG